MKISKANKQRRVCDLCVILLFTTVLSVDALAQSQSDAQKQDDAIDEIVITAQKRGEQSLQDTAMSIKALTGRMLEDMGARNFVDYARNVPGITFIDTGGNKQKVVIRGIATSSRPENQESVAVYLDDAPISSNGGTNGENGHTPNINLFDMERIEVLRGPQSTLYGASAMGGTIRLLTNRPDPTQHDAKIDASFSSTEDGGNSTIINGMVNLPIVEDRFAVRAVGYYRDIGGYIDNLFFDKKDVNTERTSGGRLSAQLNVNDNLTLTGRAFFRQLEIGGQPTAERWGDFSELEQHRRFEEFNNDDIGQYSFVVEYEFDGFNLTSATTFYDRNTVDRDDVTRLIGDGIDTPNEIGLPLVNTNDSEEWFEELRLSSTNSEKYQWVAGLYYHDLDKTFMQDVPVDDATSAYVGNLFGADPGDLGDANNLYDSIQVQTLEEIALFGELTINFSDRWSGTIGARYFQIDQSYALDANGIFNGGASSVSGKGDEDGINPKLNLAFKQSENALLFFTASKGYRAGGANQSLGASCEDDLADIGLSRAPTDYDSDTLWNYEAGVKLTGANSRLTMNGTVFHIDWSDLQTTKSLPCGFSFTDNAGKATSDGIEVDFTYKARQGLSFTAGLSYNNAELAEDVPELDGLKGDRVPGVPELTYSASAQYEFHVTDGFDGFFRVDVQHVGEFYDRFQEDAAAEAGDYKLGHVRLGVRSDRWQATLFANNVWNERATTANFRFGGFGEWNAINRPREIGLNLVLDF